MPAELPSILRTGEDHMPYGPAIKIVQLTVSSLGVYGVGILGSLGQRHGGPGR